MAKKTKLDLDINDLAKEVDLYNNPVTEKQSHILEAAEKLFAKSSYHETSTASIAEQAGVTEKTLFKHFPTKRDLFRRILFPLIMKTIVPLQIKKVRALLREERKSFREMVEALALDRFAAARQLGSKLKVVLGEVIQNDALRAQLRGLALKYIWPDLVKNVKHYQATGEIRKDLDPEAVARMQVTLIASNALLRAIIAPNEKYDDAKDAKLVADMLLNGVKTRK